MILASQEEGKMEGLGSTHSVPPSKFTNKNQLLKLGDCDWYTHSQFSSVAQSCPTLCDPMNRSTPGFPVHHQLPEFTQTHIHQVSDASVVPFSSCPQSLPTSEYFPMSQLFAWGGQSTGVSALASVLSKKFQGWSPSEWTGWISLQSKGLSRVFSNTTVQRLASSNTKLYCKSDCTETWICSVLLCWTWKFPCTSIYDSSVFMMVLLCFLSSFLNFLLFQSL